MTKDVLLSISGLHQDVTGIEAQGDEPGSEPIEVIVPASYYEKNGKHYVIYDELVEGIPGTIKNKVRILDDQKVEIIKSGITNTHMVFEKDKINMTQYETPYGEMMIGVFTKDIQFEEQDEKITVHVNYAHQRRSCCRLQYRHKNNSTGTISSNAVFKYSLLLFVS